MSRRPAAASAVLLIAGVLALSGCTSTVSLQPAADADEPACADVTVRLPALVDGEERRWTDAQATGAWGDPASVILTCGVTPPGPTTLPCQSVNGVDWIIDESEAPRYRVTTFGRTPAVEVYLDNDLVSSAAVLDTLSRVVSVLPADGSACTDAGTTP
ncbi:MULTISPECIES: DUF3515 domain-containing protein [unclassified Microbacterium]|uniref:DUF3515 domain-containing protein n=1 Tax=unclassified Microbacterium TaxID=2609290 RepID=UPI00214B9027|nr:MULTISPECIES: DUF3515 domain-containing protein [unclassified Microbacterium]MCR2809366.1 DUF3515 domain-containing protein [Microbacterium sp. zg.B185]WIM20505.1 DUF3515 domain-containing protein [Microbacterium sp. zg-B185]